MNGAPTFDDTTEFPDFAARGRYARLVGLDEVKQRLAKEARILLNPVLLREWSERHHGGRVALIRQFEDRLPLFIFAGDVGTGKTALAETFGDAVARSEGIPVTLFRLSLNARGKGAVGEMTQLISGAFAEVAAAAATARRPDGRAGFGVILLIDEADALAQSRELDQMHHEDRAGVNALLRGLGTLVTNRLPAIVVMCTNRLDALDPAVRRRAAATFSFERPDESQRAAVLTGELEGTGITAEEVAEVARATGPTDERRYGHTYSDLTQRLLPAILLDAFPDRPITFDGALALARSLGPTPPFRGSTESGAD